MFAERRRETRRSPASIIAIEAMTATSSKALTSEASEVSTTCSIAPSRGAV